MLNWLLQRNLWTSQFSSKQLCIIIVSYNRTKETGIDGRINTKDVVIDSNYAQLTLDKAEVKTEMAKIKMMIILDPDKDIAAAPLSQ